MTEVGPPQEHTIDIPNPWRYTDTLAKEIEIQARPVNYGEIIGDNSVLMLGEGHGNSPIREHIAAHAADFKAAGITHYAIEAPHNPAFDNTGQYLGSIDLGPLSRSDKSYENAVQAMMSQGIKIVGADIDQTTKPSKEEREAFLANSVQSVLASDPTAKVGFLIGGFHTTRKDIANGIPSITARLTDQGVKVAVAQYAGGSDEFPRGFIEAVNAAHRGQSEFMMDLRPYEGLGDVAYGKSGTDFIIHLREQFRRGPGMRSDMTASFGSYSIRDLQLFTERYHH